jgi:hypothetical protein
MFLFVVSKDVYMFTNVSGGSDKATASIDVFELILNYIVIVSAVLEEAIGLRRYIIFLSS